MTYRIERVTIRPLPPLPGGGPDILPEWATPALRAPAAQPWPENQRRFAVGLVDNSGNTGWFGPVCASVAAIAVDQVCPAVTGVDVRAWRAFTDLRPAGRHRFGAHARMAVSAVELAAWDLRSRLAGIAVEALLGGAARTSVSAYATALGVDIDHPLASDIAAWIEDQGFWGQKWRLPGCERGEPHQVDAARLARIRDAIGDRARVCIDVCGAWSRAYARQMLPILAENQVSWIEEPGSVDAASLTAFGLAHATGEHDYDPQQQLANLTGDCVQVWQPDPAWNGGLAHTLRMVEVAAMRGIACFPHGTALAVAARLTALLPATAAPAVEYHLTLEPLRQAVFHHPVTPIGGVVHLDGKPGLTSTYLFAEPEESHAE